MIFEEAVTGIFRVCHIQLKKSLFLILDLYGMYFLFFGCVFRVDSLKVLANTKYQAML